MREKSEMQPVSKWTGKYLASTLKWAAEAGKRWFIIEEFVDNQEIVLDKEVVKGLNLRETPKEKKRTI
jgi:hypothetical protein